MSGFAVGDIALSSEDVSRISSSLKGVCRSLWDMEIGDHPYETPILPTGDRLLENRMAEYDDVLYNYEVKTEEEDPEFEGKLLTVPQTISKIPILVISTISSPDNFLHAILKAALPEYTRGDYASRTLMVESFKGQISRLHEDLNRISDQAREILDQKLIAKSERLQQHFGKVFGELPPYYNLLYASTLLEINIGVVDYNEDIDQMYFKVRPPFRVDTGRPIILLVERINHFEPMAIRENDAVLTIFPSGHQVIQRLFDFTGRVR